MVDLETNFFYLVLLGCYKKDKLYEFLMGLDNNFTIIKTKILVTLPTPG